MPWPPNSTRIGIGVGHAEEILKRRNQNRGGLTAREHEVLTPSPTDSQHHRSPSGSTPASPRSRRTFRQQEPKIDPAATVGSGRALVEADQCGVLATRAEGYESVVEGSAGDPGCSQLRERVGI